MARKIVSAIATAGASTALVLTVATAPARAGAAGEAAVGAAGNGEVTIQSCHGSAKSYNKSTGFYFPAGIYALTTGNCADINIRTNNNTFVKVCFFGKGCQAEYKRATAGQWTVVATNVKDDVFFQFQFYNDGPSSGLYAA